MNVPRFLFFDLGRVLLTFDHEQAVRQLAEVSDCDADQVRKVVFGSSLQSDYERGQLETSEFCDKFRAQTNTNAGDQEICRAASDIFAINQSVIPLVSALRQSGWAMGILSNTCDAHWSFVRNAGYGFIDLFDPLVLSFNVQSLKPDAGIFEKAVEHVGLEPAQIFFVDDLQCNVLGARAAGLDAVQFTSASQLIRDLRSRGVRFNL